MLSRSAVRAILDAASARFEGKAKASAVTLDDTPFDECSSPTWWAEVADRDIGITNRTMSYMAAYAMLSGGTIPLRGLKLLDGYFRPDQYVIRALTEHGLIAIEESPSMRFVFTQAGWDSLARYLQGGKK